MSRPRPKPGGTAAVRAGRPHRDRDRSAPRSTSGSPRSWTSRNGIARFLVDDLEHRAQIYETGWMVLKAHQSRGIATEATALVVEKAKTDGRRRYLHAFPPPANGASNAICRKLGFTLLGEVEFEFPPGNFAASNDWRLDLTA